MSMEQMISGYLKQVQGAIAALPAEIVETIVRTLDTARREKRNIYIFGNGGSAATASHFVCDLNKQASTGVTPRFRAMALVDNTPVMMAWANDASYEDVFTEQLTNFLEPGDVAVGISASGNSPNVVNALSYAREQGAVTIALTGFSGGRVKDVAGICLVVPNESVAQIEDVHSVLVHLVTFCLISLNRTGGS